jgi:hypothetical protein
MEAKLMHGIFPTKDQDIAVVTEYFTTKQIINPKGETDEPSVRKWTITWTR